MTIDIELSIRLSAKIGVPVTVRLEGSLLAAWKMDEPRCIGIGRDAESLFADAAKGQDVATFAR